METESYFVFILYLHVCLLKNKVFWKIADQNGMFIVSVHLTWCEKMDLKIIQSLLERVQIHKHAGKPKNLWELKDFSEEQTNV